jgi:hypothetical protein
VVAMDDMEGAAGGKASVYDFLFASHGSHLYCLRSTSSFFILSFLYSPCTKSDLLFRSQIKYLCDPDPLLDAVKEEQARAHKAGCGAHSALVGRAGGMAGNRGACQGLLHL